MLRLVTPLPSAAGDDPDGSRALLDLAAPGAGDAVLVLDRRAIGLLGALLRRNCREAALLDARAKPEPARYDLVILPDIAPGIAPDDAAMTRLCHAARRALVPTGRLVIRVTGAASGRVALRVARHLREAGFLAPRAIARDHATLLSVALPDFRMKAAV
jgi:hypothetical protein